MPLGAWEMSGDSGGDDQSSRGSLFSSARLEDLAAGSSANSNLNGEGESDDEDEDADLDSSGHNAFSFIRRARLKHQRQLQQQRQRAMESSFVRVETPNNLRSSMSLDVLASSMNSSQGFSMSSLLMSSQYGPTASQSSFAPFFVQSTRLERQRSDPQDEPTLNGTPELREAEEARDEEPSPLPPISWSEMLRFATPTERALMMGGLLSAAFNGAIVAASMLVIGRAFAAFALLPEMTTETSADSGDPSSTIKRAAFTLVLLGIACWLTSSATAASTARSTRRQLTRMRIALLRQLVTLGDATTLEYLEQTQRRHGGREEDDNGLSITEDAAKAIARSVVYGDAHSRALEWLLAHALGRSCRLAAQFIGGMAVAFATSWQLALVVTLTVVPVLTTTLAWLELYDRTQQQQRQESNMGAGLPCASSLLKARAVAAEALSSVRTLIAFNAQRPAQRAYTGALTRAARAAIAQSRLRALVRGLETGAVWALLAVVVGYASNLSDDTNNTNERLMQSSLAVLVAALALIQLVPTLVGVAASQQTAAPLFALLDANPELLADSTQPHDDHTHRIPPHTSSGGAVEFCDVHTLSGGSPLRGVTFSAAPGERVAVVGGGCGSIASLLGRFGSPAMGQILLDGRDVQAIDRRWLRSQLAIASSTPVLFAGSIFDNIAMGLDPDRASEDASAGTTQWPPLHVQRQVVDAAKLASAHEFIMALPNQYATRVDQAIETSLMSLRSSVFEAGEMTLTTAQRQLIALARSLIRYSSSRVLVLDRVLSPLPSTPARSSSVDRRSRKSSAAVESATLEQAVHRLLQRSVDQSSKRKAPTILLLVSSPLAASSALLDRVNGVVDRVVQLHQGRTIDGGNDQQANRVHDPNQPIHNHLQRELSVESSDGYSTDTSGDEIVSANDYDKESAGRIKRAATDGSGGATGVSAGDRDLPWATLEHFEYSFHSEDAATPVGADGGARPSATTARARQASVLSSYNSRHRLRAATLLSVLPPTPHSLSQASMASSSFADDDQPSHAVSKVASRSFGVWEALSFTRSERRSLRLALSASALLGLAAPLGCVLVGAWAAQLLVADHEDDDTSASEAIWWAVVGCAAAAVAFALVQATHAYCSTRVSEMASVKLQTLHFRALLAQPMGFFDARSTNVEVLTSALAAQGPTVAATLAGAAQSKLIETVSVVLGAIVTVVAVTTMASGSNSDLWWQFTLPALMGVLPLAAIGETLVAGTAVLAQAATDQQQQQQHALIVKARAVTSGNGALALGSDSDTALDHATETLTHLRTVMALGIQHHRCDEFARRMQKEEVLVTARSRSSVAASLLTSGGGAFLVRFAVVALLLFAGDNALDKRSDDEASDVNGAPISTSDARESLCGVLATIFVVVMTAQALGHAIAWWQRHSQTANEAGAAICEMRDRAKVHAADEREMNTVVAAPSRVEDLSASAVSSFTSSFPASVIRKAADRRRPPHQKETNQRLPNRQRLRGAITFRRVTFAYPDGQNACTLVLRNANMNIRAGETVALCGAPGSGKSTILALLERFYDPQSVSSSRSRSLPTDGTSGVFFDGIDARALEVHWVRDQIGLVSLTELTPLLLFRGSITNNIALGVRIHDATAASSSSSRPSVSHDEIVSAAQAANAHAFISHLPDGYATRVDSLDESQALRVALARAIVRNPPLLLIDGVGTGDIDEMVSAALVNVIAARKSSGKTTVLTTRTRLNHTAGEFGCQRRSSSTHSASPLGLDGVDVDKWLVVSNGSITELNLTDDHQQQEQPQHLIQHQQKGQQQEQTSHAVGASHAATTAEQLIDRFWSDIDDDDDDDDDDIAEAEPEPLYVVARQSRPGRVRITLPPEMLSLSLPPSPSPLPPPSSSAYSSSSPSPTSSMASSIASYRSLFSV